MRHRGMPAWVLAHDADLPPRAVEGATVDFTLEPIAETRTAPPAAVNGAVVAGNYRSPQMLGEGGMGED